MTNRLFARCCTIISHTFIYLFPQMEVISFSLPTWLPYSVTLSKGFLGSASMQFYRCFCPLENQESWSATGSDNRDNGHWTTWQEKCTLPPAGCIQLRQKHNQSLRPPLDSSLCTYKGTIFSQLRLPSHEPDDIYWCHIINSRVSIYCHIMFTDALAGLELEMCWKSLASFAS